MLARHGIKLSIKNRKTLATSVSRIGTLFFDVHKWYQRWLEYAFYCLESVATPKLTGIIITGWSPEMPPYLPPLPAP